MLQRRFSIVFLVIALIAGIVAAAYFASVFPDWTGFGPPILDAQGKELPHAKTLWDWLGLLLVPVVIAVAGYLFTSSENNQARKIETARAQDAALQAYLDQMTQLLLREKLRTSKQDDEVRSVARARTLTVLRVLDSVRKTTVVQFLYEANLVGSIKREGDQLIQIARVIVLDGADLKGAHLEGALLQGAHLERTNLEEANLEGANLEGAHLERTNLEGANLEGAHLERTNLEGANLEGANLEGANLEGAVLREAHLKGVSLIGAHLRKASLLRANLGGAALHEADLRETDLSGADLNRARLIKADLSRAILIGTNIEWANLEAANLTGTNLENANILGAFFKGADLSEANLTNCNVTEPQISEVSSLEGAILPFDLTPPPAPEVEIAAQKDQAKKKV